MILIYTNDMLKNLFDKVVTDFKDAPKRYMGMIKGKSSSSDKTGIRKAGTSTNISLRKDKTTTNTKVNIQPKRKVSPMFVGLIIVFLVVLMFPDEPTTPEVATTATPAEVKTPQPPTEPVAETPPPVETTEATPTEPVAEEPIVTDEPAMEPTVTEPVVTDIPSTEPTMTEPVITEPVLTEPVVTEPVVTETIETPATEEVTTEPTITDTEVPTEESPAPTPTTEASASESASADTVAETKPAQPVPDISEQILADLENQLKEKNKNMPAVNQYVIPPDYDYLGRGLVYNCKGKHWACIDAPSYKNCENNFSFLKQQNKSKECYPVSVFQTDRACQFIQKKKVSGNSETSFCQ
jgi:hypothetical protein